MHGHTGSKRVVAVFSHLHHHDTLVRKMRDGRVSSKRVSMGIFERLEGILFLWHYEKRATHD